MSALFVNLVAFIEATRYGLLFVGTLLGSPAVMVAAGYFVHLGQLQFLPVYLTVVSADIVGDIGWYWVGRTGARSFIKRFGHYFGMTPELIERLEFRFLQYHERILIMSKLTMGFGGAAVAVLAVAGMMRVPFWRYLGINLAGELVWALIPITIGYYFGNVSELVPNSARLLFVFASFLGVILVARIALRKIAAQEW